LRVRTKDGKTGIVVGEADFDPRKHPNARRKPRSEAGRTHYQVKFPDGEVQWFSKYEVDKVNDFHFENETEFMDFLKEKIKVYAMVENHKWDEGRDIKLTVFLHDQKILEKSEYIYI
jgi:hypothetical protein